MKKASVVMGLLLLVLLAGSANAQEWSAEQKEVIAQIKVCWDGWVKAFEEKNYDLWAKSCPCDNNAFAWFTKEGAPTTQSEYAKRGLTFSPFPWGIKKTNWLDLRPISVKIDGDLALVHFYSVWVEENYKGEISQIEHKRLEVFRKKNGRWTLVGGMIVPVEGK
jgi:ketosteroid isomerase-like protein